jgi:hypothetical protein
VPEESLGARSSSLLNSLIRRTSSRYPDKSLADLLFIFHLVEGEASEPEGETKVKHSCGTRNDVRCK